MLAEAFNHMLDRLVDAFAAQREFVADASHELRTPLTVMRGQLEVLAAGRGPQPRGAAARRAPDAGRDRADLAPGRRPAAAGPVRARRLPAHPARRPADVRPRALGRTRADRQARLPARDGAATPRCPPTPTGSPRRCATSPATRSSTPPSPTAWCASRSSASAPRWSASRSSTTGRGSRPPSASACSSASTASTPRAPASAGGAGLGLAIVQAIADAHHGTVRRRLAVQTAARASSSTYRGSSHPRASSASPQCPQERRRHRRADDDDDQRRPHGDCDCRDQ